MKFNYEDRFQFLLLLLIAGVTTYILTKEILITLGVVAALFILFKIISRRNIIFKDEIVVVNSSILRKNNFSCRYNDLKMVYFEQIYTTTYVNVIVTLVFEIDGMAKKTKYDVSQYSKVADLVKLLRKKNVHVSFKEEHLEMEIGRYLNL